MPAKTRLVQVVPFLFTFANAVFGFLSIILSLNSYHVASAYFIVMAALMDGLDGRLARKLGVSSYLGGELDSLSDAVSFCIAPAILLYSAYVYEFGIAGILILSLYVCAGLFRLAKFNVTSSDQKDYFLGLPTTLAAFVVACTVLYNDWLVAGRFRSLLMNKVGMLAVICLISILMISKVRFPTYKGYGIKRGKALYAQLALLGFVVGLCLMRGAPVVLILSCIYIVFYTVRHFSMLLVNR